MIKIGLTGNIASGKTYIRKIFEKLGIKTICADFIVHQLLENDDIKNKILFTFRDNDILTDNILDRRKLGKIVFSDKEKKDKLEKIIHPIVIEKIHEFFNKNKEEKIVLVDVPLLFEGNFEYLFDKIMLIYANDNIRFERIKKRNNFEDEYIKKIMNSQLSQEIKKEKSDFIIINENKSLEEIEKEVEKIIKELI